MNEFVAMAVLNGTIAAAYLVMATYLAPRFGLPPLARIAAIGFFTACGLTHAELTVHTLVNEPQWMVSTHMFVIHGTQAVVDWGFIVVAARYLDIRFTRRMPDAAERLAEAHQLVSVGAWEWDARRDRVLCSAEFAQMCGEPAGWHPSAEEFIERRVHPDDRAALAAALADARADEQGTREMEYRVVRPDGEVRVLFTRWERSTKKGELATVVGASQDVTERRVAEEQRERARVAEERADREHRIAEILQRSLLPTKLPDAEPLQLAARYLPARSGADVGGDWYDVLPLANGQIGLVMGDVVGRGITAAALVGKLRNGLRAYAYEGHPPAATLERVVQRLAGALDEPVGVEEQRRAGLERVLGRRVGGVADRAERHRPAALEELPAAVGAPHERRRVPGAHPAQPA